MIAHGTGTRIVSSKHKNRIALELLLAEGLA